MENSKTATMRQVQETFATWKTVNDRIKLLERTLQHHHASRDEPVAALNSELQALHREAERLLLVAQQALLKIKTPRSSSGDSTWG
jgi:hypothetical protein